MSELQQRGVVDLICGSLATLFNVVLFVSLLYVLYSKFKANMIRAFKYTAIIIQLSALLFSIMWIAIGVLNMQQERDIVYRLYLATDVVVAVSEFTFYLMLLLRLYHTFSSSAFAVSTWVIAVHVANMFCLVVFMILSFVFFLSSLNYIFVSARAALLAIGLLHLLTAFNHKLFALVLSQRHTVVDPQDGNVELNERQKKLLETIRKHALLGSIIILIILSILVVFLLNVIWRYQNAESIRGEEDANLTQDVLVEMLILLDVIAAPLCVYLGFAANDKVYRWSCKLCDKACAVCCESVAARRVKQGKPETMSIEPTSSPSTSPEQGFVD